MILHPTAQVFLGRKRPVARGLRLPFANYQLKSMPDCPVDDVDYSVKPADFLKQVLLNNQLGCCTASGAFHIGGSLLANAGFPIPYTDTDVKTFYEHFGYVDGNPDTDNGASEIDVLNFWQEKGLLGDGKTHRIMGRLSINGTDERQVMAALYAFENLYFGIELADSWLAKPPADGQVWPKAPGNPNNGHCAISCKGGKKAGGIIVDSWGYDILMPFDSVAQATSVPLQGELYAVLSPDGIVKAQQKFPNGLDWSQLVADICSTS